MKVCPTCSEKFVGLSGVCDSCRRRGFDVAVTESVTLRGVVTKPVTGGKKSKASPSDLEAATERVATAIDVEDMLRETQPNVCPTCGHRSALSSAERSRRYRARKNASS